MAGLGQGTLPALTRQYGYEPGTLQYMHQAVCNVDNGDSYGRNHQDHGDSPGKVIRRRRASAIVTWPHRVIRIVIVAHRCSFRGLTRSGVRPGRTVRAIPPPLLSATFVPMVGPRGRSRGREMGWDGRSPGCLVAHPAAADNALGRTARHIVLMQKPCRDVAGAMEPELAPFLHQPVLSGKSRLEDR